MTSGDLRTPQFNDENYDFWLVKMETILIAYDLWDVIEFGIQTTSGVTSESEREGDEIEAGEATVSKENRIKKC